MKLTPEKLSKTMAFALRHDPSAFQLTMNSAGWVSIHELAAALSVALHELITVEQIAQVVAVDGKKRYAVSEGQVRASQGHSFPVDLGLVPLAPPVSLYHGTVREAIASIFEQGLISQEREYVHLSASIETAMQVGARRGKPVLIEIKAQKASESGVKFFLSENNVWLSAAVPAEFLILL